MPSSSCPPWPPDTTGQPSRRARYRRRSYTTPWGTILNEETQLGRRVRTTAPVFREAMAKSVQANGTVINYELATQAKLGSRNLRLIYVVNHLRGATVYRMFFYRTDRGWDVVALQAETNALKFDFN